MWEPLGYVVFSVANYFHIDSILFLLIMIFRIKLKGPGRGGDLYFRLGIILIKGLSKHTLNRYFSGIKIDPKYAFLGSCSFQNLSIWPKTYPFFPILHVFAPLNDVRAYIARSWKTTLITWIFLRGWYPTSNTNAPPLAQRSSFPFKNIYWL